VHIICTYKLKHVYLYITIRKRDTLKTVKAMNTLILDFLKTNREKVEKAFEEMVLEDSKLINIFGQSHIINSKKFFFQVVFDYCENMSKAMITKCLKSELKMYEEFYKAIDKAIYACHKPGREYFSKNMR